MRKTGTRLLAVLLAVVMVLPSVLIPGMAAEATGFTDVPEGSWYADAVNYVSEKGYMTGVGDNRFAPNDEVTRAMFVTILARITMAETDGTVSAFTDVPANKWYTGAVSWAAENGIVNGVGDGMFAPGKSITRQDLCTILYRFVNAMDYELTVGEEKTFTDGASVSSYAAEAVRYASSVGLIAGYDDGTFRPKATATRAQMAVIIMRLARLLDGQIVKPEPMPAQSFNGAAGEDMSVSVNAPKGALPENTNMTVSRVTDEAKLAAIKDKTGAEVYAAADITFSKDGAELEPETAVEVQIALDGLESIKNPIVVHVKDDGSVEYVSAEVISTNRAGTDKALRFYAKDFSVYAVINPGNEALLTITFYDKDGTTVINTQVMRFSQMSKYEEQGVPYVFDPGVPSISNTQSFEGWSEGVGEYNDDTVGMTVAEINEYIGNHYNDSTATSVNLKYRAMVFDVVYVIYHDQNGAVLKTEGIHTKTTDDTVSAYVNMTYVPFKSGQNFEGWTTDIQTMGYEPTYSANPAVYKDKTNQTFVKADFSPSMKIHLYPYVESGHWLSFDNYIDQDEDTTSGSYTAPVFYATEETTAAPADPTRTGYTFKGWYTDKSFETQFTFGSELSSDTVIYAKWEPTKTSYMVVYMVQNATDANDTDVSNNTYSFYDYVRRDWKYDGGMKDVMTGDTVTAYTAGTVNDTYLSTDNLTQGTYYAKTIDALGQYFKYSEKNNGVSTVVKGDGTSILFVYYDRKQITIRLHNGSYSNENSALYYVSDGYVYTNYLNWSTRYFALIDGKYEPLTLASTSSAYPDSYGRVAWNYATFTLKNSGKTWTKDRNKIYAYVAATTSSATVKTMTGLYGAPIPEEDLPDVDYDVFSWAFTSSTEGDMMEVNGLSSFTPSGSFVSTSGNPYEIDYYLRTITIPTKSKPIHYITQDPDTGAWGTSYGDDIIDDVYTVSYYSKTGHKLVGYNYQRNSMQSGYHTISSEPFKVKYDDITGTEAYLYYELTRANLIYHSLGEPVRTESLRYGQSFGKFEYKENSTTEKYIPENAGAAYEFQGWYYDESYQDPVDFENDVMPDEPVNIYAKWMMKRYRIVLDPTGGDESITNPAQEIVFPGGTQATTFRVNYGELVQGASINNAHRKGYTLIGWYLDKDCTIPFNFSEPITDAVADMTYRDAEDERQGNDPWTLEDGHPKTYSDVDRPEVVGKVTIYAKWREEPKGAIGINVTYDAASGMFTDGGRTLLDSEIYADTAQAFGQPASKPAMEVPNPNDPNKTTLVENPDLQFLYWEIMKPTVEDQVSTLQPTGKKVYPGQIWTVLSDDAVQTVVGENNGSSGTDSIGEPKRGIGGIHPVTATNTLLTEGFEGDLNWYVITVSGNGWTLNSDQTYANNGSYSVQVQYDSSKAADAYLISESFTVSDRTTSLNLSLFECVGDAGYPEKFEAFFIKDSDLTTDNDIVNVSNHHTAIPAAPYTNTTYAEKTGSVTDLAGENVRLVIHCTSDADMYYLYIDDITVTETITTTYTWHFTAGGGTGTQADMTGLESGKRYQLPTCTFTAPAGKQFSGWKSVGGTRKAGEWVTVYADSTFEAQWEDIPKDSHKVTVTYVGPEGDTAFPAVPAHEEFFEEDSLYAVISPDIDGYTPDNDAITGTMGTGDLNFVVKYTKDTRTQFMVYLRAHYGRASKTAKTHITWYSNNGTATAVSGGDAQKDINLDVNEFIDIPKPQNFNAIVIDHDATASTTDTPTGLAWEDHVFVGWARVNVEDDDLTGAAKELTAKSPEMYLLWDETSNGFKLNLKADEQNATPQWSTEVYSKVAADEMRPYHDMYAVWTGYYYVFHSSTGKIEAVELTKTKKVDETTGKTTLVTAPQDLFLMVPDGYLYGGYYSEYGGTKNVNADTMRAVKNTALANRSMSDEQRLVTVNGATTYDATTDKIELDGSTVRLWNKKDAYGKNLTGDALDAVNGRHMTPVAGEIYYLREVPNAYLPNVALAICDKKDESGNVTDEISKVYVFSASDELVYSTLQFSLAGETANATVSQKFIVDYREPNPGGGYTPKTMEITPADLRAGEGLKGKIGWVLSYEIPVKELQTENGLVVKPSWTTYDGVTVYGDQFTYKITSDGKTLERNK